MSIHCTIESSHGRILDKISLVKNIIGNMQQLRDSTYALIAAKNTTKYEKANKMLESLHLNLLLDAIESIENEYMLAVAHVLSGYYSTDATEGINTKKYYQIVASENIAGKCNDVLRLCGNSMEIIASVLGKRILTGKDRKVTEDSYCLLCGDIDYARGVTVGDYLIMRNNDNCSKCGSRMQLTSETAELRCDSCLRTKKVVGSVLHYDSNYCDGQKSKHNGYDIVRHLRFWLERLQALESKTFEESVVTSIAYVVKRDGIIKTDITCEIMRRILKDPCVDATYLNDHVPLLVKTFGGIGPPTFDYDETKILTARFIRAMNIHSDLKPSTGNKPYYPHFIYKIAEEQFKSNPEKIRILNYIHLQSTDTIEKNDKYFSDVCDVVNDADSGLVYRPTMNNV
jgi:Poxvirus Late Transcription Factor VLTF3 like